MHELKQDPTTDPGRDKLEAACTSGACDTGVEEATSFKLMWLWLNMFKWLKRYEEYLSKPMKYVMFFSPAPYPLVSAKALSRRWHSLNRENHRPQGTFQGPAKLSAPLTCCSRVWKNVKKFSYRDERITAMAMKKPLLTCFILFLVWWYFVFHWVPDIPCVVWIVDKLSDFRYHCVLGDRLKARGTYREYVGGSFCSAEGGENRKGHAVSEGLAMAQFRDLTCLLRNQIERSQVQWRWFQESLVSTEIFSALRLTKRSICLTIQGTVWPFPGWWDEVHRGLALVSQTIIGMIIHAGVMECYWHYMTSFPF